MRGTTGQFGAAVAGRLVDSLTSAPVEYAEYPPPPQLAGIVRCVWTLRGTARGHAPEPALPDGSPELILNLGDPFRARGAGQRMVAQPRAMLVGQITRPFAVAPTGRIDLVAARFLPFGASRWQRPMDAITDGWVRLPTFDGVRRDMLALSTAGERRDRFTHALVDLAREGTTPDPRVQLAVQRIEDSDGLASQGELSALTGASARTLQRLFARDVGVPIKLLARIRRFQRVFSAWRDDPSSWAQVAVRCGYFDQAHLVRDFNELGGAAPAGLVAQLPRFTRLFTALGDVR